MVRIRRRTEIREGKAKRPKRRRGLPGRLRPPGSWFDMPQTPVEVAAEAEAAIQEDAAAEAHGVAGAAVVVEAAAESAHGSLRSPSAPQLAPASSQTPCNHHSP